MWGKFSFSIPVIALVSLIVSGCLNQDSASLSGKTSSSATGSVASSSATTDPQCAIFANNINDLNNCTACKQTYCSCAPTCTSAQIIACSMNINTLAQCVHNNTFASGGSCAGLVCGDGQVADFVSCSCKDAVSPSSYQPAPGTDNTGIARMQVGYSITNKFCSPSHFDFTQVTLSAYRCVLDAVAAGQTTNNALQYDGTPMWSNLPAINVYQDTGYLRWDLALDISQYPLQRSLEAGIPFYGTYSTIPMNLYFSYQLKPYTDTTSDTILWTDCAEHFSSSNSFVSSNTACSPRSSGFLQAPDPAIATLAKQVSSGSAEVDRISLNGNVGNGNFVLFDTTGNKKINPTTVGTSAAGNYGFMKLEGGTGNQTTDNTGTGLASNIGYYKYTFGPLGLKNTKNGTIIAGSNSVTGALALNVNLGYTPASAVDSTALSPNAISNTLNGRDCTTSLVGPQCVVTAVYRGAGGGVLSQSFSPKFSDNYHSSAVSSLPSGVIAVSTPKIVEDIAQDLSTSKAPARLRTFVRASDGNIYMSVYKNSKWNSWLSLGRPWICQNPADCAAYTNSGVALTYKPLNLAIAPLSSFTFSTASNDGVSVIGEPVVTSFMDTSPVNGVTGYIAVAIRVSHINSSTGAAGALHNAIFYNIARVSGIAATNQFDDPNQWSGWMPVYDSGTVPPTLLKTFGNPIAILHGLTATPNKVGLHFIAQYTTSGLSLLHPPIAQPSSAHPLTIGGVNQNIYNYANSIQVMSVEVDTLSFPFQPGLVVAPAPPVPYPPSTGVGGVGLSGLPGGSLLDSDIINTDLSWTSLGSDRIRVFAGSITSSVGLADKAPRDFFNGVTISRGLIHVNFNLTATSAGMDMACANSYHANASYFVGTPYGIDLSAYNSGNASQIAPTTQRLFVFGRMICPKLLSNYCDTVTPTLGYITQMDSTQNAGCATNGAADMSRYFYGRTLDNTSTTGNPSATQYTNNIQPTYSSSDVIPVLSNALFRGGYDVPVYLLMRSSSGILSHSFWGGQNNNAQGFPSFQVYSKGAFTN